MENKGNLGIYASDENIYEPSHWHHRTSLPAPMPPHAEISIWGILKQCIGKDLSKITMPIVLNEPLSFLQRLTEYMEYSYLIEKANQYDNPIERMEMVAAFAVSGCATNWNRLGKPFNPLLGETYELDMPERGFRMVCEQTSHHPPISAFHAESPDFRFHGSIQPKSKFWGKALDVQPLGIITLELLKHNEVYTWTNPNCSIHNIIVGKLWIEHSGPMNIVNHTNGYKCSLNFRPAGMFGKEINRVDGFIYDHNVTNLRYGPFCRDVKTRALYGHWNLALYSTIPKIYDEYLSKNVTDKMLRRRSSSVSKNIEKRALYGNWTLRLLATEPSILTENLRNSSQSSSVTNCYNKLALNAKCLSKRTFSLQSLTSDQKNTKNNENKNGDTNLIDAAEILSGSADQLKYSNFVLDLPKSKLLWKNIPKPNNSSKMYNFSLYSMMLNEPPLPNAILPPTDSRFRPDIRQYELGHIEEASNFKVALEQKQRAAAKTIKELSSDKSLSAQKTLSKVVKGPLWFKPKKNQFIKNEDDWNFSTDYWKRDYSQCPSLYHITSS